MARAARPEGPYIPGKEPILKGNVIDPHLFVPEQGPPLLYWKEDNNDVWPGLLADLLFRQPTLIADLFPEDTDRATASLICTLWPWIQHRAPMERFQLLQVLIETVTADYPAFRQRLAAIPDPGLAEELAYLLRFMRTPVYAAPLAADGSRLAGEKILILENDQAWEAHLVEGIWVTEQRGQFFLFYAGNDFSTGRYGIGVAIAPHPLGPYRKMPAPFLRSAPDWWAPGHPCVVKDPEGCPCLLLHAFYPGKAGYGQFRALLSLRLEFTKDSVRAISTNE
jgi:hypothetical protein